MTKARQTKDLAEMNSKKHLHTPSYSYTDKGPSLLSYSKTLCNFLI